MAKDAKINSKEAAVTLTWVLVPGKKQWVLC